MTERPPAKLNLWCDKCQEVAIKKGDVYYRDENLMVICQKCGWATGANSNGDM